MLRVIIDRLKQGHHTMKYPDGPAPKLPDRFRGCPRFSAQSCQANCSACQQVCPTGAITVKDQHPVIDMGKCLFCGDCVKACPGNLISFSSDYHFAGHSRQDLIVDINNQSAGPCGVTMGKELKRLFGRSLKLRQVSAGGCNACEADTNVLNTLVWDLGRFGIQFVASPRHADGLLITGPVTKNMELALKKTYDAVADPKIVIAVGSCAISGGPFIDNKQVNNGAEGIVPIDLYIPGCPPHPLTILDGLIRFIGRKHAESAGQDNKK